jgi:hypothetical protein
MLFTLFAAWLDRFGATLEWVWHSFVGEIETTAVFVFIGYLGWHWLSKHRWSPIPPPPRGHQFWKFMLRMFGYGTPLLFLYMFSEATVPSMATTITLVTAALAWFLVKIYRPNLPRIFTRLTSVPRFAWLSFLSFSRKPKAEVLSGWKPLTARQLTEMTKKLGAGLLTLGGVPIPTFAEVTHFLFRGTTGVGKTKAILENLFRIRKAGCPCVIVDPAGELMARYFKPGDYILSPLDARAHKIDFRDYLTDDVATKRVATIMCPSGGSTDEQKRWAKWGQDALVPVLDALASGVKLSDELILHMFTAEDKVKMNKRGYWQGTGSQAMFLEGGEKWFTGVRGILSEQLNFMTFPYADSAPKLNLQEWVDRSADAPHDSVLWLPFPEDQRDVLRPLYSIIISLVASRLLSLRNSDSRRMFFIIDELAQLGRVEKLKTLLEEGRKKGASVMAGFQHDLQMADAWGPSVAKVILSLFNTKILYRPSDEEIATRDSKRAGAYIEQRYTEGSSSNSSSSGASSGQSFSEQITPEISAVPFTELLGLPNLHGYLVIQHLPPGKIVIPMVDDELGPDHIDTPPFIPAVRRKRKPYAPPPEDNPDDPNNPPKKVKRQTKKPLRPTPKPKDPDHLNTRIKTDDPPDQPTPL